MFMGESTVDQDGTPGLSSFVDVFDRSDLFDRIDNQTVVNLSCLGQKKGFSNVESVQKSTGISLRRLLKPGVTSVTLAIAVFDKLCCESGWAPSDFSLVMLCHSGVDDEKAEQLAAAIACDNGLPPQSVIAFNFGCSGFLKLLQEATLLLADRRNIKRIVALCQPVRLESSWNETSGFRCR
jgi:3-oxoacyl-[acyl-carrier-protein] synthase III